MYRILPILATWSYLAGCTTPPHAAQFEETSAVLHSPDSSLAIEDQRARFRQIFCQLAQADGVIARKDEHCRDALWQLADESAQAPVDELPKMRTDLRLVIVTGAFGDCYGENAIPFRTGIQRLEKQGVRVDVVRVNGQSSTVHNAAQIAAYFSQTPIGSEGVVLLGYSKGAIDVLQFLDDFPSSASKVAAVISVAGPIWGTPLAAHTSWIFRHLAAPVLKSQCDPGDRGAVESLQPKWRAAWQTHHPLLPGTPFFSLEGFTTKEHLARGLRMSYAMLAKHDTRNDGQLLIEDQLEPGSILLGYVNADHWGMAITIERELHSMGAREEPNTVPLDQFLEAIWLTVGEWLEHHSTSDGVPQGGPVANGG